MSRIPYGHQLHGIFDNLIVPKRGKVPTAKFALDPAVGKVVVREPAGATVFVDEDLLKGSNVNVDTNDRVVTLNGTVTSDAGRARAIAVARDTEGVDRVVDQIVVTLS